MISRNTDNFTGYIIQGEEKIYFHAQDKVFNFITEGVGIFAEFSKSVMKSPDHFCMDIQRMVIRLLYILDMMKEKYQQTINYDREFTL